MSVSLGDAVLYLRANDSALDKTLKGVETKTKKSMEGIAAVAGKVLAGITIGVGVATGIKKIADETMAYNLAMNDLSLSIGVGVEDTSRLIQASDDYRVSQATMTRSLQLAVKNGFLPTIENVANLSDHLLSIQDPTRRAAEASKIFGKGWAEVAPFLLSGGDAIRANTAALSGNLVVTNKEVRASQDYYAALDGLQDAMKGFAIVAGNEVIPAATGIVEGIGKAITAYDQLNQVVEYWLASNKETTQIVMDTRLAIAEAAGAFENYGLEAHGAGEKIVALQEEIKAMTLEQLKAAEALAYINGDTTQLEILRGEIALREGNNAEISRTMAFLESIRRKYDGVTWRVNVDVNTPEGFGITSGGGGGAGSGHYGPRVEGAGGLFYHKNLDTGLYEPAQHGLDGIVPPGFPNDTYRVGVSSGEHVRVETKEQQKMSAGGGGDTYYQVTINDRHSAAMFLAMLEERRRDRLNRTM